MSLVSNAMPVFTLKGKIYAALFVLFCMLCSGAFVWYLLDENEDLAAENVTAVADAAAASEHGTILVKNEREYSNTKRKADEALKDNPEYRDAPVPESVADILRDPARPTK